MQTQTSKKSLGYVSVPVPKRNNCCDLTQHGKPEPKTVASSMRRRRTKSAKAGYDLVGLAG